MFETDPLVLAILLSNVILTARKSIAYMEVDAWPEGKDLLK